MLFAAAVLVSAVVVWLSVVMLQFCGHLPVTSFVPEDCVTPAVFHPHLYLSQTLVFISSPRVPQ